MHKENITPTDASCGSVALNSVSAEGAVATGTYTVECRKANGELRWTDTIKNVVTEEGKTVALHNLFKSSAFTQTAYLGLISSAGYTTPPAVGNTAANISTTVATNGWREVAAAVVAARGTPSFGTSTPGGGNASLATSTPVSFSVVGADTIKGCFVVVKNLAGTAPSSAAGGTTGALYSAGLFTAGDKPVANGDTLNVSYTATLS